MSDHKPSHLRLITSSLRWDWRRENPVELVVLVFFFAIFFTLPRVGCGVSAKPQAQGRAVAAAPAQAAPAQAAPAQAAPALN